MLKRSSGWFGRSPERSSWSRTATAGAPIEVAAPRLVDRLARIVHIDSFALDDGEAVFDTFPPPIRDAVLAQVAATGSGWLIDPLPPALLGLERAEDIAAVMPRLTRQPVRTMQERVSIDPGADDIPRTYVQCMVGAETRPFGFFADRGPQSRWDSREFQTGHEVMITDRRFWRSCCWSSPCRQPSARSPVADPQGRRSASS